MADFTNVFQANAGLRKSYIEESIPWPRALVDPGKPSSQVKLASFTSEEVEILLLKLAALADKRNNEAIAIMVGEEAASILIAARMVKAETKADFAGILGVGSQLDVMWLRPKNVGETATLNTDATAGLGLYQGTSAAVYTWEQAFIAGTSKQIIPEQKMSEQAGVVHLGAIDPTEIPKINAIKFTLAGIPAPGQSCAMNHRESLGASSLPFCRWEKPVIVGPEKKQKVEVMPGITGNSKLELLSILIGQASDLTI